MTPYLAFASFKNQVLRPFETSSTKNSQLFMYPLWFCWLELHPIVNNRDPPQTTAI